MLKQNDLKIADWEYLYAEQILDVYIDHLEEATKSFAEIMDRVQQEAISDDEGGIQAQCENYGHKVRALSISLANLGFHLKGRAEKYVEDIDKADQFMYGV